MFYGYTKSFSSKYYLIHIFANFCYVKTSYFYKNYIMTLTQEDWVSQLEADENAVILDVRTEEECNNGIIPNAINIDIYEGQMFIEKLDSLDKTKNYYVYCRSGARSAKASAAMNNLGFENTYNLLGGIIEWDGEIVSP